MLCIKKKKTLLPRLICSSPPVFFFFCFPGNPHLSCSVSMETDVCVVPSCMATVGAVKRQEQTWAVIHRFIFLWVKGYRAPISIYMTPPFPSPPLPSRTAVIDRGRRWLNQISCLWSVRLFTSTLSTAFQQLSPFTPPSAAGIHLINDCGLHRARPSITVMLKTHLMIYGKCFSKNIKKRHWLAQEESF